jgi:hypothetical protein
MTTYGRPLTVALLAALAFGLGTAVATAQLADARIFIEYNSSDNDLGFHVFLDGEDWRSIKIVNPNGRAIFDVDGRGPFRNLGMTELFFEGAEPSLDEFPLDELLALFPEGPYTFVGTTVDGERLENSWRFTHAVPAPVPVSAMVTGDEITIRWEAVSGPPSGFPNRTIQVVAYQVIVDSFQVTLPASSRKVTLPREFVRSLASGEHGFEVLAIEKRRNQTITVGSFLVP